MRANDDVHVDEEPTELMPPTESAAAWLPVPTLTGEESPVDPIVRPVDLAFEVRLFYLGIGIGVVVTAGLALAVMVPCAIRATRPEAGGSRLRGSAPPSGRPPRVLRIRTGRVPRRGRGRFRTA